MNEIGEGILVCVVVLLLGTGCNKKAEQCTRLNASAADMADKLDIDVSNDKDAKAKSTALQAALDSTRKAKDGAASLGTVDSTLAENVAAYTKALGEVETSGTALKEFFDKVVTTDAPVAAMTAAKAAVDEAMQSLLGTLSLAEKKKFALSLAPYGDSASDLEKTATAIEGAQYQSEDSTKKAAAAAAALRKKATAQRGLDSIEQTLADLEKQSEPKRNAFKSARGHLKKAAAALKEHCGQPK